MQILFKNERQVVLADMLWNCTDIHQTKKIIEQYGTEAKIVFDMLVAEYLDNDQTLNFQNALEVIDKCK